MAVTPLAPATFAPAPAAPVPVTADPSVTVAPPAAGSQSGGADTATSEQSTSQKLPLEKALDEINEQMKAWSTQLQFEVDPDVHQVVVSVVDAKSGDVIRTIPSEAVLKIAKMIVNMQGNGIKTTA
ncbi:flagellar protein [Achromobacter xylosoxidans]|jgi:flagellar protein FlaG|uniref:Flagellar protein FlaG n=4 Tax=Achromobacter TaxID=222 RepID=A0A6S7EKF5_9BURK|nr:flagellar protein FlaG [Achromobacter ruhlandii]AKP90889.1 putative flagellar protein [Achromobacter xylosoxidans]AMG47034.1 flagellar protein [Achromobacter xylosoxidans]AOU94100.1 flagellar protein [Achromobacter ruhlandii]MCI1838327.1 flagellar protein FlaG [Achromobacter ruhlandii]MCV6797271.1 flagellar protein FlaG [Achromobacter ruhlandii]